MNGRARWCGSPRATNSAGRGVPALATRPVRNCDKRSMLTATTLLALLNWLMTKPSCSRSCVRGCNADVQSQFQTDKCQTVATQGVFDFYDARLDSGAFVPTYRIDNRESGIRYARFTQNHAGEDQVILGAQPALYVRGRVSKLDHLFRNNRIWSLIGAAIHNPERKSIIKSQSADNDIRSWCMAEATTTLTHAGYQPALRKAHVE